MVSPHEYFDTSRRDLIPRSIPTASQGDACRYLKDEALSKTSRLRVVKVL